MVAICHTKKTRRRTRAYKRAKSTHAYVLSTIGVVGRHPNRLHIASNGARPMVNGTRMK